MSDSNRAGGCLGRAAVTLGLGLLLLFGPIFIGVGLLIRSGGQAYDDGVLTTGEVIDYEVRRSDGDETFTEVVRYLTTDGEIVEFTSSLSTSSPNEIGSQVRVSYRPSEPEKARNLDDGSAIAAWVFIGLGSLVSVITLIVLLSIMRKKIRLRRAPLAATTGSQLPSRPVPASDDWEARTWDDGSSTAGHNPIGDTDFISDEDRGF